jgi:hypothetical protein
MLMPTLDTHHDLTISQMLQKLFDYFLLSDYSQTNLYRGNVASLKYILLNEPTDTLLDNVKSSLYAMYNRYFESPRFTDTLNELDIEAQFIESDETNIKYLMILISATVNDKRYTINKDVSINNIEDVLDSKYLDELDDNFNTTIF